MSRVGKMPIKILQGVKVEIKDSVVKVEGPKGKLSHQVPRGVNVKVEAGSVVVTRDESISTQAAALHGLTRTLIHNMVHGAHTGFTKELDIVGVGYRAAVKGSTLSMTLHP
ncbi:50S ribosomal protein L6 [bacterium]|nr:50S ribosomal protein L6 [bacterium]